MMPAIAFVVALGVSTCHTITADRIYARDLALALPVFQPAPPDQIVGLSPFPGQQRVFRPGELRRIAMANNIPGEFLEGVCFSWPMSVPSTDAMRAAMLKTLGTRNAHIEIVDQSLAAAPPGEMAFPLTGLSGTSGSPVIWRGTIAYADKRIFTIWARVRVTVQEQHVVAGQALKPGEEISAAQLKLELYDGPLTRDEHYGAITDVVGLTPRNSIAPGMPLTKMQLRERSDVERGDLVQVTVEMQRTHLEAQGVAEENGQKGAVILVRNARSGRKFRARVEAKGKVLVIPEGPTGLVTEDSKHEASN